MASDEVRVEMGKKNVVDVEFVALSGFEIALDVALRVYDGRGTRSFVADEVRSVRETIEVELLEDHLANLGTRTAEIEPEARWRSC